jgi:murein DD-endopeptidase MepM/ murein hydrolase activator NlpD
MQNDRLTAAGTGAAIGLEGRPAPTPAEVRQLTEQFESLLLGQMLRQMRTSLFDDDADTGFADGPLSDTVFAELSLALSRAGGIGIGNALAGSLMREADGDQKNAPAGVLPHGRVSSGYGWRSDPIDGEARFHRGLDIALPSGSDVPAARAGRVTVAGELAGYGLTVVVEHRDGVSTRYAHLSELTVAVGQDVAAGEVVARSGASGRATGPHLHFEVLEGGRAIDPTGFLENRR